MGKQNMKASMIVDHYAPEHVVCSNDRCKSGDVLFDTFHNSLDAISNGWSRLSNDGKTLWICRGCSEKVK